MEPFASTLRVEPVALGNLGSMSDTYDDILRLRAIRDYRPDPMSEEDLHRILRAARATGSSKNRQNWSFIVVRDPDQIEALAATGSFTGPVRNAPLTIALVQEEAGYEFDTGRVAQNIMLAAAAIGVASCPITLHRDADAAEVLGLPEGRRCRYAIAMGYPAEGAGPRRMGGRKPLDDLVHHERYGG